MVAFPGLLAVRCPVFRARGAVLGIASPRPPSEAELGGMGEGCSWTAPHRRLDRKASGIVSDMALARGLQMRAFQ